MRLIDLSPRWVHPHVFIFQCPCGCRGTPREVWLSCKTAPMPVGQQWELFRTHAKQGDIVNQTKADAVWTVSTRDFHTMTVSPSLHFGPSLHWHGNITNGVCS